MDRGETGTGEVAGSVLADEYLTRHPVGRSFEMVLMAHAGLGGVAARR